MKKPGLRKRFFAWLLKKGDSLNHQIYHFYKQKLFKDLKGIIVEVGPGSGINFSYLPSKIEWLGLEPNEAFHETLFSLAREKGINARLLKGDAEHIPLPDSSADAVLCTLVLCSVPNPDLAIAEMKRILKPGGKLIFIEHVAAPSHSRLRFMQTFFNPLNRVLGDGCNCNRETWTSLERAGFTQLSLTYHRIKDTLKLHEPHIMGIAIK